MSTLQPTPRGKRPAKALRDATVYTGPPLAELVEREVWCISAMASSMPTVQGSVLASKCQWQVASSQPGVSGLDSWRRAVLPAVQRTCRTSRRTSTLGRAAASGRGA